MSTDNTDDYQPSARYLERLEKAKKLGDECDSAFVATCTRLRLNRDLANLTPLDAIGMAEGQKSNEMDERFRQGDARASRTGADMPRNSKSPK